MAFNAYPDGAGGTTGDGVAVNAPLYLGTTGHVWYVSSLTGSDAVSPKGRERVAPLATLSQAVTNAAPGDVIDLMENHVETISISLAVSKVLTIVSEGLGSSRAKLICGGAISMLVLSQPGTVLNNVYFPASTVAGAVRLSITSSGIVLANCYFECGPNDNSATISYATALSSCRLTGATFRATGSQPAIAVSFAGTHTGFFLENVTFDGGSFGFSDFAFKAAGIQTAIYANDIRQLNGADVSLAAGWTGFWLPANASGSARFEG